MTQMTIARYASYAKTGTLSVVKAEGDDSTSIADLAQFVQFDTNEAKEQGTSPWCVAYGELLLEYGYHEMVDGEQDFYDGFFMKFTDGSELRFAA